MPLDLTVVHRKPHQSNVDRDPRTIPSIRAPGWAAHRVAAELAQEALAQALSWSWDGHT